MSAAASERDPTEAAHVAALAGLPGMGPATLVGLLAAYPPRQAWAEVRAGRIERPPPRARAGAPTAPRGPEPAALFSPPEPVEGAPRRTWAEVARSLDPAEWWQPHAHAGTSVTWLGRPDFPAALSADPRPPGALFWRGRIEWLDRPCVAIVGTRTATPDGRSVAFQMGRDLAAAGVCVVSGLALGIDGAAHAGALAAVKEGAPGSTVGVAASGPDVAYPRRHARLWRDVTTCGAIISENLPGRPAQAWRFPTRNRIIAGLVSLVVVVESHRGGGSLITAEAAIERGVEVRVVPGPVHSPASEGSNQLLYDGPGPVRHAQDVLDALGDFRPAPDPARGRPAPAPAAAHRPAQPPPDTDGGRVLDALGWRPASTGQIMARTGLDAATVARCLDRLSAAGLVGTESGWWSRRT
jgi:DNA processing protein